jgi:tight adherence protein B
MNISPQRVNSSASDSRFAGRTVPGEVSTGFADRNVSSSGKRFAGLTYSGAGTHTTGHEITARSASILIFASICIAAISGNLITGVLLLPVAFLIRRTVMIKRIERERLALSILWPEIIDHIISGLHSGLSLAETLVGLSQRGPIATRSTFKACEETLRTGGDLEQAFVIIKERFNDGLADQVCEVLDFARGTGSRDTSIILRSLGEFIRSDIALRAEIRSKHGWVKNSALIAAIAPWILLLILCTQKNTLEAYSTPSGAIVLTVGIGSTLIAYFWMERVGRLPKVPRIFA